MGFNQDFQNSYETYSIGNDSKIVYFRQIFTW